MELNKKTSLTSFNFQATDDTHMDENVLSKILDKVIHVVHPPDSSDSILERYSTHSSAHSAHDSIRPSLSSITTQIEQGQSTVSLNLETVPRSSTSTTATHATTVTTNSQKSDNHDEFSPQSVHFTMPQRQSLEEQAMDYLLLPLSKRLSMDSDTQSVVTNFSISNSNSLSRIIARLRGQKSDKEFWMPDEQCKECYKCRKPFTLLRRKHHCRTCGQIFCGKCASHIISGKMYKQKGQVRVCNFCYAEQHHKDISLDHYKSELVNNSPLSKTITLPNTEPVIPSQKPPLAVPQMQISSTAFKHARSAYGNNETTTVALEIPSEAYPSSPKSEPLSITTTEGNGLKRLLDAGNFLLKPRPRSNTSSSAPLDDTSQSPIAFRRPLFSPSIQDRGGGTKLSECQLSPYPTSSGEENDFDYQSYDTRKEITSPSSSKLPLSSVGSDDESYDHRLRMKRTEELRGSSKPIRRLSLSNRNSNPISLHRLRKVNSAGMPSPEQQRSPSEDKFNQHLERTRPRQRRISGPPPTVELSLSARHHARSILQQLMADLDIAKKEEWENVIMNVLLKVANHVQPDIRAGDDMDVRHYVKIKKIPGGLPSDSFYVKGVVCTKNVAHKRMIRNLSQPRILILLFSLEYSRLEMENQLLSIEPVIFQEREHINKLVGRIIALKPSLLIVQSTVSRLALEKLLEAKIPVVHNVKHSVIEAIARCTEAAVVPSVDKLQQGLSFGRCGSFEIRTVMHEWIPNRRKTYLIFDDCSAELGGTIVLRGDKEDNLRVIKKLVDFMVFVVHNLKLETSLLRDSFAKNKGSSEVERNRSPLISREFTDTPEEEDHHSIEHNDIVDLIGMYQHTILSVSQYVTFPPPYLLTALKETEDKITLLKKRRSMSSTFLNSKEHLSPSPTRSTFDKHQAESIKMSEQWLEDEFDAFARYHYISRAWEVYRGENPGSISPFYHQNIVVLYSSVCTVTTVPCQGPEIRIFGYYRFSSDKTLGQYVMDLCTDARQTCSSFMCDHPMLQHYRSYAHGSARVNVMIESFPCPMPGMSDKILMWNYCKECNKPTPVLPMSENTWNYSFGKFLEIFLYQKGVHCRADICPHDMVRNHVRYFGYMDMTVRFQYDPIELLEVSPPPMRLYISPQVQRDLKEGEMKTLRSKINKFYQSIIERNKAFPFDLVDPRKLETCKAALQEISSEVQREKKEALQFVQNAYVHSNPNDTLTINGVRRFLFQVVNQWEHAYMAFVQDYLQPERELKKITTIHLRKMFPTDDTSVFTMDTERTQRAAEVTDLPLLGFDLGDDDRDYSLKRSPKPMTRKMVLPELCSTPSLSQPVPSPPKTLHSDPKSILRPEIRRRLSLQLMHELKEKVKKRRPHRLKPNSYLRLKRPGALAAVFVPSRIPVPHHYTNARLPSVEQCSPASDSKLLRPSRRNSKEKKESSKSSIKRYYLHRHQKQTTSKPEEEEAADYLKKTMTSKDKRFRSRLPRKKTYIQMYTEANDLVEEDMDDEFYPGGQIDDSQSTLSNRFDQLRVRHNYGYMTLSKGGVFLEGMDDDSEEDLFEEAVHPAEKKMDYFSPLAPYTSEPTDLEYLSDSAEEDADHSLASAADLLMAHFMDDSSLDGPVHSELPPIQSELDDTQHTIEKNSFMKTLTNFLTDSGVANLLPLESPLQPTEYLFPDSFVIVREDEPSTIIAYTLNSDDYLDKMHEMQGYSYEDNVCHPKAPSESHTLDGFPASLHNSDEIQETLLRESGTHMRYNFSTGNTKFFCKIFFAEQFDALRRNCGCDDSYIMSLASCIPWDNAGGKSGSAFLKTKDDRLLMKQMSKYELDAFLGFAPAYFQYMSAAFFSELPTVLAKIFGFYSIGYKNSTTGKSMRMDVLVMENLFYQRNITKIFDLKGSMRNRHVQSTGKQDEVLLDENLVELIYHSPLFIRAHSKEILRSSLHNDALFLSNRNVMDYSLLVGIDEERQELVVGIVDFIRTFTWDKKLESWVKESGILGGGGKGPTIVSPRQYRIRFREAMERYFLMVPDKFTLIRQNSPSVPMHQSEWRHDE